MVDRARVCTCRITKSRRVGRSDGERSAGMLGRPPRAGEGGGVEGDADEKACRNSGERNRTIMMRFIESIVSGIQVHRHNRHVSISDTVARRHSIDFQFLDGVCVRVRLGLHVERKSWLVAAHPAPVAPSRCFQRNIRRIVSVDSAADLRRQFLPRLLCRLLSSYRCSAVIPERY